MSKTDEEPLETLNDVEELIEQNIEWYKHRAEERNETNEIKHRMYCEGMYEAYKDSLKMIQAINNE